MVIMTTIPCTPCSSYFPFACLIHSSAASFLSSVVRLRLSPVVPFTEGKQPTLKWAEPGDKAMYSPMALLLRLNNVGDQIFGGLGPCIVSWSQGEALISGDFFIGTRGFIIHVHVHTHTSAPCIVGKRWIITQLKRTEDIIDSADLEEVSIWLDDR